MRDGGTDLASILREGASAWTVDSGEVWCLAKVIDETAQKALEHVAGGGDDAAALLKVAWRATFRHDPDYSNGYWKAVQAVESVATQAFTPADKAPSLGKAIGHLARNVGLSDCRRPG